MEKVEGHSKLMRIISMFKISKILSNTEQPDST